MDGFRRSLWLALIALAAAGTLRAQTPPHQCPAQYLQKVSGSGGATIWCEPTADGVRWTIERPEVRQRLTVYPDIRFAPGDRVTVQAKGCVNTGPKAKMWRRYVDPYGNDTDRFYHGLIWIPGARMEHQGEHLVPPLGTAAVRITGVAGGMNTEQKPDPQEFVIDSPPAGVEPTLRLGYESARYKDNGYAGELGGNGCEKPGVGHATVVVNIRRSAQPSEARKLLRSFDPVSKQTDLNGFQFAPQWAGNYNSVTRELREAIRDCANFPYRDPLRVHRGIRSECTTQASFDTPSTWTVCLLEPGLGQLHGHVNWTPATYMGQLMFDNFSADGDLIFQLYDFGAGAKQRRLGDFDTGGQIHPILTKDSQYPGSIYNGTVQLEAAGYEVTEHFRSGGWPVFQYLAFQGSASRDKDQYDTALRQKFFRKTAVVNGLLNLDCVHDCHTELHPVFAMAVRTRYECGGPAENQIDAEGNCVYPEQSNPEILSDDSWMMFVNTAGNEGSCARDEHYLDRDQLTVVLPAPPGATHPGQVTGGADSFFANVKGLQWTWKPAAQGVAVTFSLAPSSCDVVHSGAPVRVHGAVHVNWSGQKPAARRLVVDLGPRGASPKRKNPEGEAAREPTGTQEADAEPVEPVQDLSNSRSCLNSSLSNADILRNAEAHGRHLAEFARLRQQKARSNIWTTLALMNDYTRKNLGIFGELQRFATSNDFALGVGARAEVLQTPLGSIEMEAVTSFPRRVTTASLRQFHVRTTTWLTGLRVQVARAGSPFVDAKVGGLWRSTDSAASAGTEFQHFKGLDFVMYAGAGFEIRRKSRISMRWSAGVLFVPPTGEKILRFTTGLHYRAKK